ncbi:glycosyltransferase family 2 protein [Chloroflexota bacterium]
MAAIVLNWNSASETVKCVEAVERSTHPLLKIVIVDNGSSDDSARVLSLQFGDRYPVLQTGDNLGYAAGNHVGVDWALAQGADLIWILNPDCIVRTDTLSALLAAVGRHGTRAIFCPLLLCLNNPEVVYYAGGELRLETGIPKGRAGLRIADHPDILVEHLTDVAHGANLLVPTEVVETFGFMSDAFFLYTEEADYSLQLASQGVPTIFVPSAVALHKGNIREKAPTSREGQIRQYYRVRNQLLFWRRNFAKVKVREYTRRHVRRELRAYRRQLRAGRLPHRYQVMGLVHGLMGRYGRTYHMR